MRMNYVSQVRAFYDSMLTNQLSSGQIALWHALMAVNNKCAWIEWFSAPNQTLELLSGLSRQGVNQARNILKQKGYIDFKSNGTKATSYSINILYTSNNVQVGLQDGLQSSVQTYVQGSEQDSSTLNKLNKTKPNETKQVSSSNKIRASDFWLDNVRLGGTESPMILENIDYWVKDFNGQEEIVILAIKQMLKNGAKSYSYLDKVLKNWESENLDTVSKVNQYLNKGFAKQGGQTNESNSDWDEKL